jgi:hypothetical protein
VVAMISIIYTMQASDMGDSISVTVCRKKAYAKSHTNTFKKIFIFKVLLD